MRFVLIVLTLSLTGSGLAATRPAERTATVFTAEQAAAGRNEIRQNGFGDCTACHSSNLRGRTGDPGELPPLSSLPENYRTLIAGTGGHVPAFVGPAFVARWGHRSTKDLTAELEERFAPPHGPLTEQTRLNIAAYILQANGAMPGTEWLTMATDVTISAALAGER